MAQLGIVLKMSSRNVLKYGRRSMQTFVVVFVGVAAIALADAFVKGFSDRIVSGFAVAGGHLLVSAPGYAARRATCPLDMLVVDTDGLAKQLEAATIVAASSGDKKPGFAGFSLLPILRAPCAIQFGDRSLNLYAAGAEAFLPNDGLAPPFKAAPPLQGRYPGRGERGALLSRKAAERLGASPGDSLVILASDAFGSFGAVELPLLGVTRSDPGPEACLLDLATMRELVGVPEGASEAAAYLVDASGSPVDPRGAQAAIRAAAAAAEVAGFEATTWDSGSSAVPGMLAFFDSFAYALYAIFAVVAGAGIANTVLLSVQDRTRDFGTLRAVAFSSAWVKAIVAFETLIIGAAASLAAAAALCIAIAVLGPEGLHVPESVRGIVDWMPQTVKARVDPASLALIVAGGSVVPLIAAAYPLRLLGRMKIREALGYV